MGLRFDPVGGGQFKQAVQQIIEAESQPLKTLEARKAKDEARLKLFNEFKSKFDGLDKSLTELASFRKFRELKMDLGDGQGLMDVQLDKERAEPGQYQIEISELASRTSVISNGFEDADKALFGAGFITMTLQNGDTSEIYVDDSSSSLRGIASKINLEPNSPVRASVVKDATDPEAPWKLILDGKKDGKGNHVGFPSFYFMDGAAELIVEDNKEANNAKISVNGFPIELESNEEGEFLPGVGIHLKQAKPDHPFNLVITEDYQKINGKVKGLVDNVNQILQFINKQNSVDDRTDTSTTFAGDTTLQSIEFRIRNMIHQGFHSNVAGDSSTPLINLSEVGLEFDKTGLLTFKEAKFSKAMETNFDGIAQAITGPKGFASQMRSLFDSFTRPITGTLKAKEKALQDRIKDIDHRIDTKKGQLERRKQEVVDKFSRLQSTIGDLQRQQQQMSAVLPSGGGNLVSQLLG